MPVVVTMKIAIIGAGAAGLAAAAALSTTHEVIVFEQGSTLGGLWQENINFTDTPLYPSLKTNLPIQLMGFFDFPFTQEFTTPGEGDYPGPEAVAKYLSAYANHKRLVSLIRFDHQVIKVAPESTGWRLTLSKGKDVNVDAVVVCNGHYTQPDLPQIDGIELLPSPPLHAKDYVDPVRFADRRVMVWGSNASGIDLVREVSDSAKQVFWCGHGIDRGQYVDDLKNVELCSDPQVIQTGKIILTDKTELVEVDDVIFCTGYRYDFPFLDKRVLSFSPRRVEGLVQHILSDLHPSLAFIGLPYLVIPFPLFQIQSQWLAAAFAGRVDLQAARGASPAVKPYNLQTPQGSDRHFHRLGETQINYLKELIKQAQLDPLPARFLSLIQAVHRIKQDHPTDFRTISLTQMASPDLPHA